MQSKISTCLSLSERHACLEDVDDALMSLSLRILGFTEHESDKYHLIPQDHYSTNVLDIYSRRGYICHIYRSRSIPR